MTIQNNLKEIMQKREYTAEDVSERTGISVHTIRSWTSGKRDLADASYRNISKLCFALRCSLDELLVEQVDYMELEEDNGWGWS